MLLRLVVGIVCFAALLPCQTGEVEVEAEGLRTRQKGEKGQTGEVDKEAADERLTPEQRLARNITSGASAYCQFVATVKPAKLMPGQSGTLRIVATLQGDAVIPSPAPLELTPAPSQGPVQLGTHTLRPAEAGRLAKGYLGRPVYDNFAVLEVPVTMAADALLGSKHVVAVDLKFDLYDGSSAQVIGRFLDRAATEVEVGLTPDPAVQGGRRRDQQPSGASEPAPVVTSQAAPATLPETPLTGNVLVAREPVPVAPAETESAPRSNAANTLPSAAEDESFPPFLLVGGGVLVLGLVVLLARKK